MLAIQNVWPKLIVHRPRMLVRHVGLAICTSSSLRSRNDGGSRVGIRENLCRAWSFPARRSADRTCCSACHRSGPKGYTGRERNSVKRSGQFQIEPAVRPLFGHHVEVGAGAAVEVLSEAFAGKADPQRYQTGQLSRTGRKNHCSIFASAARIVGRAPIPPCGSEISAPPLCVHQRRWTSSP